MNTPTQPTPTVSTGRDIPTTSPAGVENQAGAHEQGQRGGASSASATVRPESAQVRKLRAIAALERSVEPTWKGGYVLIHGNEITGWSRDLPEASRYIPGVAAVPESGPIKWTAGGTQHDAERWSDTPEPLPRVLVKGDNGQIVAAIEQLCKSDRGRRAAVAIGKMLQDGGAGLDHANFTALENLFRACRILGGNAAYKIAAALPER